MPTNVDLGGQTYMDPDDPKLVHYVQDVIRPELVRTGPLELIEAGNNLVAALGPRGTGRALLIQSYCVSQHHNLMDEPFSGKVESAAAYGVDQLAVFGMGASQNKAHQAVMLAVLKWLVESDAQLAGRLYWSVNCEGRSSHACTHIILAALPDKPDFCIVQYPTGIDRVSLGNRGRVDVEVHLRGKSTHSSAPHAGLSAIDGANELMNRLKRLSWPDQHPVLGGRQAVVYKLAFEPLAPHTLPSDAYLTIDRRLLPGEDPAGAAEEIRQTFGNVRPYGLTVRAGEFMLPSLVGPDEPHVQTFQAAHEAVTGQKAREYIHAGTYDAGGTACAGIPTIMYGAGCPAPELTGVDFVTMRDMAMEAELLARFVDATLCHRRGADSSPGGSE